MKELREKLDIAMDDVFEDLKHSTPGSDEYEAARKAVETISKIKIDEYKAEADVTLRDEENRISEKKNEEELKLKKASNKREKIALGVTAGSTAGSLAMYFWGLRRITKFEESGVVTSKILTQLPKLSNLFFRK